MGPKSRAVLLLVIAFSLLGASAVLADLATGRSAYLSHDFDGAIAAVEGEKDIASYVLLALAHTERYNIYRNKHDKTQARLYSKLLEAELRLSNAQMVSSFMEVNGNPNGNKLATQFIRQCFDNTRSVPEDFLLLGEFLHERHGLDTNIVSMKKLYRLMKPIRSYVSEGGTMPESIRDQVFSNEEFIDALVSAVTRDKLSNTARKCLVLVEEPAIRALQEQQVSDPVTKTIVLIRKAMAKRLKKYPASTWHSATGS